MEHVIEIIISVLLVYIAYQNYNLSRAGFYIQKDKLRLELFDRRYKTFRALQKLLATFIPTGTFTKKDISEFCNESSDADFLFGKDIRNYIDKVWKDALRLVHLNERLKNQDITVEKRTEIAEEMYNLENWFSNQIQESKILFKKYLFFSIDKNP